MLRSLKIKDFAIIEALEVDFRPGFSVITGETGAGKSIIIEAISLALGSRADTSYVRTGKEKAHIELTATSEDPRVKELLDENAIEPTDELTITREITASGKSVCRINGTMVNVGFLNSVSGYLCDIHGQYEHQALLNPETHIAYLDSYAGETVLSVKKTVRELFGSYASLSRKIQEWEKACQDSERKRDFMRFELEEITKAGLQENEDTLLEEELSVLQNSEKIYDNLSASHQILSEDEGDAVSRLSEASRLLSEVKTYSASLASLSERVDSLSYELEDLSRELRRESESVSFSEERLNAIQERLEELNRLKKKYGPALSDVFAYRDKLEKDLGLIENRGEEASRWKSDLRIVKEQLELASERLSELRRRAGEKLETAMNEELLSLNFESPSFSVSFSKTESFTDNGTDTVEFLISANKGESEKPLAKVASGGELSRIMLAFKGLAGLSDPIPTFIFDEIDTGISGITASIVGRKLKELAKTHQILCITHLPQIAAFGSDHFRIAKSSQDERTISTLERLDEPGRIAELARLTGGTAVTDATIQAVKDLLSQSRNTKC